jgi:hypothetical protein
MAEPTVLINMGKDSKQLNSLIKTNKKKVEKFISN